MMQGYAQERWLKQLSIVQDTADTQGGASPTLRMASTRQSSTSFLSEDDAPVDPATMP